jgi:hypothetical protein
MFEHMISGSLLTTRAEASEMRRTTPALLLEILVLALLAVLAFRRVGSVDVGFHLRAGEYILGGNGWPQTDPFTFTLADHRYIDTSWGYQVLIASIQRASGPHGLVLFHVALVVVLFATLARTARLASVDPVSLQILLLIGGVACEMRFRTRPELVSLLLFALVLHLLHRHAEGRASPLWILPCVHLAWANVHSLFILGWVAIACFAVGLAIGRRGFDRPLLRWGAASVAVTFVNPYGWRGVLFPLTLATRFQRENIFAQSIGEFASPFSLKISDPFYPMIPMFAFQCFLVLSLLALVAAVRRKRWWCLLLWLAFAPLAVQMMRNIPVFVVSCFPATVWGIQPTTIVERLRLRNRTRQLALAGTISVTAAACVILALRVTHDSYYVSSRRVERFGWDWSATTLPIGAARYAKEAQLNGRVFNTMSFGGYLMWALHDPVFIDSRLEVVGEQFYADYQSVLTSEQAMETSMAQYNIRWAVFPYAEQPRLFRWFNSNPRWRLVYADPLACIFVRREASSVAVVPVEPRFRDEPESLSPTTLGALPGFHGNARRTGWALWLSGLVERTELPWVDMNLGAFHLYRGDLDRAEARFARAIRTSKGAFYEPYMNLGAVLYMEKRFADARECYRVALHDAPDNAVARARVSELGAAR